MTVLPPSTPLPPLHPDDAPPPLERKARRRSKASMEHSSARNRAYRERLTQQIEDQR